VRNSLWCSGVATITGLTIAITDLCSCNSSTTRQDGKTVLAAQDEVYAAAVRDMITPYRRGVRVTQLVFGDEVLNDRKAGTDMKACEEEGRSHWDFDAIPYDSVFDKIYWRLTGGWANGSAGTETVEDFFEKSCSTGHLSRTFSTDLPRSFVAPESVHFEGWPLEKNGVPSIEKLFPGAEGIISFSHVGFDAALDEAVVSTSFYCDGLCGTHWRYTLKKKRQVGGYEYTDDWGVLADCRHGRRGSEDSPPHL
jgi:hypothetical protein